MKLVILLFSLLLPAGALAEEGPDPDDWEQPLEDSEERGGDDDDSADDGDDDDDGEAVYDSSVPLENRVLGGGCDPAAASLASAGLTGGIGTVFSLLFGLMLLRRRS